MQLSADKVKKLCKKRGITVTALLRQAKVSKTAYYSLLRKDCLLPKSLLSLARSLRVKPAAFLQDSDQELNRVNRLRFQLQQIMQKYPKANPENVWHTLLLLELKPLERLKRGLLRGKELSKARRQREGKKIK
ncbi:MAG: hypothetical protein HYU97_06820 [Deltaproteobacteria bacterium]|nr:hypothetical protein [Deltaproteobacteria bacterium]